MRREHFYRNKKAVKRSAAGAALAIFLALQITGCSQTADQNKADRKTEQAQGTEKEGTAAEESSAETEKNGTGTDKPKDTGNNESGQEKCPVCVMQYLFRLFRRYTVLRNDPFQACLPVSIEINMKRIGSV